MDTKFWFRLTHSAPIMQASINYFPQTLPINMSSIQTYSGISYQKKKELSWLLMCLSAKCLNNGITLYIIGKKI